MVRVGQAWSAASSMRRIWKHPERSRELKLRICSATGETVLLHGSSCWCLSKAQSMRLDGTYTCLLRKALDTTHTTHTTTNATLYGDTPRVSSVLRERRLRFAGHCLRREGMPESEMLFWEAPGTFRVGGHARKSYPKALLKDSGLDTLADMKCAMNNRLN